MTQGTPTPLDRCEKVYCARCNTAFRRSIYQPERFTCSPCMGKD